MSKYSDLIEQSESALNKMMLNSQRLNDALSSALNNKLWAFVIYNKYTFHVFLNYFNDCSDDFPLSLNVIFSVKFHN